MQGKCWWPPDAEYCRRGWHPKEKKPEIVPAEKTRKRGKRSYPQEKPETFEREDTESERFEAQRRRTRCDRSGAAEADFQIALAKLKLDTDTPDEATLQEAYRQRMTEIEDIFCAEDLPDKCNDLTHAFRLVALHLELDLL